MKDLIKKIDKLGDDVERLQSLQTGSGGGGVSTASLPLAITGSNMAITATTTNDGGTIVKQATTPGTAQTGNINISGKLTAGSANLSGNMTSGSVSTGSATGSSFAATGTVSGNFLQSSGNIQAISGPYFLGSIPILDRGGTFPSSGLLDGQRYWHTTYRSWFVYNSTDTKWRQEAPGVFSGSFPTVASVDNTVAPHIQVIRLDLNNGIYFWDGTVWTLITGPNLNPTPKNWLINGNFDVCQRYGPGGSAVVAAGGNGSYVLDRWRSKRDGTGATVTVSQQSFTAGQTAVPGEPTYFLRHAQTVAGTTGTSNVISQYIEDVRTFAGQTVTVSEYLKAAATATVNVRFRQFFGTGGSADVTTSNVANSVTTSWQKFTGTFSIPSVSGKTITSDSALVLEFQLPLNVVQTIDLAQSQVEAGSNAGAFQDKSILEELRDCYRYYRKCFQYATIPANSNSQGALLNSLPPVLGGTFFLPSISLGVALRISPVAANCTFYNSGGGTAGQVFNFTRSNSSTAVSINAAGSSETVIAFQVTAFPVGWVVNDLFSVAWTIDAEF